MQLPVGTKVRIIDPQNHYYGRVAWIEGDNEIKRFVSTIDPGFYYHFYVITPDGEDIEHGQSTRSGLEIIR